MGIREAVVTGGHSRLRPVIMTTLTTILGMVPMAIGTGQGSEMWRPMGTAVIGGLTVSTILTLILIPVLYCVFASVGVKRKRKKHHERLLQDVKINSKCSVSLFPILGKGKQNTKNIIRYEICSYHF